MSVVMEVKRRASFKEKGLVVLLHDTQSFRMGKLKGVHHKLMLFVCNLITLCCCHAFPEDALKS